MTKNSNGWKVHFPDDGETFSEAHDLPFCIDFFDASHKAVKYDFHERDGWERPMESEFTFVIVSPIGEERTFTGWNEASVDHCCREVAP